MSVCIESVGPTKIEQASTQLLTKPTRISDGGCSAGAVACAEDGGSMSALEPGIGAPVLMAGGTEVPEVGINDRAAVVDEPARRPVPKLRVGVNVAPIEPNAGADAADAGAAGAVLTDAPVAAPPKLKFNAAHVASLASACPPL